MISSDYLKLKIKNHLTLNFSAVAGQLCTCRPLFYLGLASCLVQVTRGRIDGPLFARKFRDIPCFSFWRTKVSSLSEQLQKWASLVSSETL